MTKACSLDPLSSESESCQLYRAYIYGRPLLVVMISKNCVNLYFFSGIISTDSGEIEVGRIIVWKWVCVQITFPNLFENISS